MVALVTMDQARLQLHEVQDDGPVDANIAMKLEQATGIVIDYLKTPDHGWTALTVPEPIHAAILLVLTSLYDSPATEDPITPAVESLCRRYRDPAMA